MSVYVKARDVRDAIKEHGFERGVTSILERMCEENAGHRQALMSMAELQQQVIDSIDKLAMFGDSMKVQLQEIKRRDEQYNTIPGSVIPDGHG